MCRRVPGVIPTQAERGKPGETNRKFVCWLRSLACSMWRIESTSQTERRAENLCLQQMETAMKPQPSHSAY